MLWNIFWIFFIHLSIYSFSAEKFLQNIRKDYCELYCKGLCNDSNTTCHQNGSSINTNNYVLDLNDGNLTLKWINSGFVDGYITPITNETNVRLKILTTDYINVSNSEFLRPSVYYLRHLGVQEVTSYNFTSPYIAIYEKDLNYSNGSKYAEIAANMLTDILFEYIQMSSLNNLQELRLESLSKRHPVLWMKDDFFVRTPNLKRLQFADFDIRNLTANVFNSLPNLQGLNLSNVRVEDLSFLRCETLEKSLVNISLDINLKVHMKYFKRYTKLENIFVDKYEPYENLTAKIFNIDERQREFTVGINGIKCPDKCSCEYYWVHDNYKYLFIDCAHAELKTIPPLPNVITGDTLLYLESNYIEELPKNTLSGYNDIKYLKVPNNRLTSLAIDRLPKKLQRLDIRDNGIQTLDKEVIEFLSRLNYFEQAGNPWFVNCDDNLMLEFLRNISYPNAKRESHSIPLRSTTPVFHYHLNAPCPDGCHHCCFNLSTGHFWIDCRHSDMELYPELPHSIPYYTVLQLDRNKIASITDSLGHASLRELYLFENKIKDLPFHLIPKNIAHLDLRKNMLEALDDQVVDFFRDRKVQLSGNPWTCDCRAKSFLSFLRKREPMEYTAALDRCNISGTCPATCICCLDNSTLPSLIIDCRFKRLTEIPTPLPTPISGESTLHFEGNHLGALPSNSLRGYAQLRHLYLANNRLTAIDELPVNITTLDIRNNSISVLNRQLRDFLDRRIAASAQLKLFLSGNPWACTCEDIDYLQFVKTRPRYFENVIDLRCDGGTAKLLIATDESDLCPSGILQYVTLSVSFMLVGLSINLMIYLKQPLLIWLYEHNVCLSIAARVEFDKQKKFDAFLSFTHKDEQLIEEFVERLESGPHKFRLCFYLRDWLVGVPIPECISQSVKDSKRIIILMTNNFLKSTWGRLEFRLALHATFQDRCKRLIVVLYPEVENFDDLDSELRTYMVLNTYLKRDDPNFWNKLTYSMPHVNVRQAPDPEAIELSVLGNV